MRYATWQLNFESNEQHGTGPEGQIGDAEGAFFMGSDPREMIVGYVHSNHDLTGLSNWNVQEISGEQALGFAHQINEMAIMDSQGRIVFPTPYPNDGGMYQWDEVTGEWVNA